MLKTELHSWLRENEDAVELAALLPIYKSNLPKNVNFDDDRWDLISWVIRKGNRKTAYVSFEGYQNSELKFLVKTYILHKRETKKTANSLADNFIRVILELDKILGPARSALMLNNEDFKQAGDFIESDREFTSKVRTVAYLVSFGEWLSDYLNLRITYKSSLISIYMHGRKAAPSNLEDILVPIEVIKDLISAANNSDITDKDKFYIYAFVINVTCGFRVNELATLPADCLVEEESQIGIRFFPEKSGKLSVRWINSSMVQTVKKALDYITQITEPARQIIKSADKNKNIYLWRDILRNQSATKYFVEKLAYEWTSNPHNNLFNKSGAWYEAKKIYLDVLSELEASNGSVLQLSRRLNIERNAIYTLIDNQKSINAGKLPKTKKGKKIRTSWDTDSRVFSLRVISKKIGVMPTLHLDLLNEYVKEVQKYQLSGKVYPKPALNIDYETQYELKGYRPLIVDKDNNPILEAKDALFVLQKYSLSQIRYTIETEVTYVNDNSFSRWLSGEKRSLGTKSAEDSCFNRLGIMNPKTGEVASFTWHDIRRWLNTVYQNGGLTDDQIALIFGRKVSSNHVYDLTDIKTRTARLRESVRKGEVLGHLTSTYNNIAEYSREEAEQYLAAKTIMVNPMPHGLCSNNWSAMPCPHHLSCFTGGEEQKNQVCEHLEIDPKNNDVVNEIKRINNEAQIAINVIPVESPQHKHFQRVEQNTSKLLNELNAFEEKNNE